MSYEIVLLRYKTQLRDQMIKDFDQLQAFINAYQSELPEVVNKALTQTVEDLDYAIGCFKDEIDRLEIS